MDRDLKLDLLKWYSSMGLNEVIPDNNIIEQNSSSAQIITTNSSLKEIISYSRNLADQAATLDELRQMVENFEGCEIKKMANKTVFSDGNPSAKIMLIGEAPGANEDLQGIPFCGDSGKLMDNMLAAISLRRADNIYITNTIFWRPPGNRKPTPEELAICLPFIEKHIGLINPSIIVLVGSTAVSSLLNNDEPMTKLRQKYDLYTNKYLSTPIHVTAIFHPSYLLRQPSQKKLVWHDLLYLRKFLANNKLSSQVVT